MPDWLLNSASANRWVASELMTLFASSVVKATTAMRPYGARSRRAGTAAYLEEQAANANTPQRASACCIRTGCVTLFLAMCLHLLGTLPKGQEVGHRGSTMAVSAAPACAIVRKGQ